MKLFVLYFFWSKNYWCSSPRVQLTICQHWFRKWRRARQATSHCLNYWRPSPQMHRCVTRLEGIHVGFRSTTWASYQIRKIAGCACAGNAGNVPPRRRLQRKTLVSDPVMHHGTCVTHVPWCMSGSLTSCGGETFPAHAHPQLYVSGKRPMQWY